MTKDAQVMVVWLGLHTYCEHHSQQGALVRVWLACAGIACTALNSSSLPVLAAPVPVALSPSAGWVSASIGAPVACLPKQMEQLFALLMLYITM